MQTEEAKVLTDLAMTCALACVAGQATVTIATRGKRPPGFPRGELLSVGTNGAYNYACHPVKVLAWLHARMSKTHNVGVKRRPEPPQCNPQDGLWAVRLNEVFGFT